MPLERGETRLAGRGRRGRPVSRRRVNVVLEIFATVVKQEENVRGTGIGKKGDVPVLAGGTVTNPEDLRFGGKNNLGH